MSLSSVAVISISSVFTVFFCCLVYYFHKEKRLFLQQGWVKVLAKEKKVERRPYRNDGEHEVDITCHYKFEVNGVEFIGRKPYFGDFLARLDEAEFERHDRSYPDDRDVVYYLKDDPKTSVAFFAFLEN
jgi:hypothetical protein